MVVLSEDGRDLILHSSDYRPCAIASRLTMSSVVAMIVGLSAPVLVFAVIDPSILAQAKFMLTTIAICAMLVCIMMYVCSAISPGPVKAVTFDRRNRRLILERQGNFASTSQEIDFEQISSLRMVQSYDQDGYGSSEPMVVLRSREGLTLPAGTAESHLQALRTIVGFK